MGFNWKDLIGSVAPTIATALGGPLAGLAVKAIADSLGVDPTEGAVSKALANASPEMLAAIQKADQEFQVKMAELNIDLVKLAGEDKDSARNREVKTGDSGTPRALALFAVLCFVGLIFGVMHGVAVVDGMKDTFLILVGAAIAVFKDVYGYYFGSSAGSRDKDKVIADAQN
jgi:hypothetical protein